MDIQQAGKERRKEGMYGDDLTVLGARHQAGMTNEGFTAKAQNVQNQNAGKELRHGQPCMTDEAVND
jgi:hypothetical protein